MLSHRDAKRGFEILRVPENIGQFMLTKPLRDINNFLRRVEMFKRTRRLFDELSRTQQSGPSCQCARLSLNVVMDWTYWCPAQKDSNLIVWVTASLGTQRFCRQKGLLMALQCEAKQMPRQQIPLPTITQKEPLCEQSGGTLGAQESKKESGN